MKWSYFKIPIFILFNFLMSGCSSLKSNEKNKTQYVPLDNYCTHLFGNKAQALAFSVQDKGISHTRFLCTYDAKDKEFDQLPGFFEARTKMENAKTEIEKKKYSSQAWNLMVSYQIGKCPKDWTSEIIMSPLGWACTSPEFPISELCSEGTFFCEKLDSKPRPVICFKEVK